MTKNSHFAMQLSFTLNLNLTLVKNTYDMLNIIFKKCLLVSVGQEKLLNFVDLNQIFILVLILNIFPNMHQIALQSIQISKIFRGSTPPDPPSNFWWKLVTQNAGSTPLLLLQIGEIASRYQLHTSLPSRSALHIRQKFQ